MKGVITAGGLGARLRPLTLATNKHLLPVYDQPMVFYPIQTLVKAGITEVMVTVGGPQAGHFVSVLKNGDNLGLTHLEYAYQEGEGGIPAAIALAEKFAADGSICVILGDNTTDADISSAVRNFNGGSVAFFKEVPDPERYGVPVFDQKDKTKVIRIEEKPKKPKSNYASTGLYIFDNKCFDFIRNCKPSARGELEIPDVQNQYIDRGELKWEMLDGFWTDAGKFETLFAANAYWAKKKGVF
ncbi:MAG: sugar phosphate nucleotidyltransferase [Patescibacteria group bacterium]